MYQVVHDVHPGVGVERPALEHVEELLLRLLANICSASPHSVQDVAKYVQVRVV